MCKEYEIFWKKNILGKLNTFVHCCFNKTVGEIKLILLESMIRNLTVVSELLSS